VGSLPVHEIVTVNQIKGKRARLIDVINGEVTIRGWVSTHRGCGESREILLAQVCEL